MLPYPNFVSQLAGIGGGVNRPITPFMPMQPGGQPMPVGNPMPVNSQLMRPAGSATPFQAMGTATPIPAMPPVATPAPAMAPRGVTMPMQPQNALRRMVGAA